MTKVEELLNRWWRMNEMTNQEILEFRQEAHDFFQSDAPEEDKKELGGYMESVVMVCHAIEQGLLENRKPSNKRKEGTFLPLKVPEFLKRKRKENMENEKSLQE